MASSASTSSSSAWPRFACRPWPITDQSALFSLVKFYRVAQARGVKPIIAELGTASEVELQAKTLKSLKTLRDELSDRRREA